MSVGSSASPANALGGATLRQANSSAGSAIIAARALGPGDSTTGNVTIENHSDAPADFRLATSHLVDRPGPGGGHLAQRLELRIEQTSGGAAGTVYAGPLARMTAQALGRFAAGEARTYRFSVSFPDGGAGGD